MTDKEIAIVRALGEAYNDFVTLAPQHPLDQQEFAQAIHVCQNIILARSAIRELGWEKLTEGENPREN